MWFFSLRVTEPICKICGSISECVERGFPLIFDGTQVGLRKSVMALTTLARTDVLRYGW